MAAIIAVGYVLDKSRLINGQTFDEDYFDHLISEIQEIRASERRFYQQITDIYATAVDYSLDSQVTKETESLKKLLTKSENSVIKIQKAYSECPTEVKELIIPIDVSDEDYAQNWMNTSFEGKAISDNLPFFETKRKERVRSKSELNIANMLADKGIPYKYECPLQLRNGATIYPDFTVLNVKRRKVFYWEHRGMMDDKDYARNAVQRIKTLMKEGLFIGEDLIITEETSTNPLGTNEIDAVIKRFLL